MGVQKGAGGLWLRNGHAWLPWNRLPSWIRRPTSITLQPNEQQGRLSRLHFCPFGYLQTIDMLSSTTTATALEVRLCCRPLFYHAALTERSFAVLCKSLSDCSGVYKVA